MGSFSIWHWLIVLIVVALVFGTKRLRSFGGDLGTAVKSFKEAVNDGKDNTGVVKPLFDKQSINDIDLNQKK